MCIMFSELHSVCSEIVDECEIFPCFDKEKLVDHIVKILVLNCIATKQEDVNYELLCRTINTCSKKHFTVKKIGNYFIDHITIDAYEFLELKNAECDDICERGDVDALFNFIKDGYSIPASAVVAVIENEHLDCFEMICSNNFEAPVFKYKVYGSATSETKFRNKMLYLIVASNNYQFLDFYCKFFEIEKDACCYAAQFQNINFMRYLYKNGSEINQKTLYACLNVRYFTEDTFECFKFIINTSSKFSCGRMYGDAVIDLAQRGELKYLKFLHNNSYPLETEVIENASISGNVKLLEFLESIGLKCNNQTCLNAIKYGKVDCLKYACENYCPFDMPECFECAGKSRYGGCYRYLKVNYEKEK